MDKLKALIMKLLYKGYFKMQFINTNTFVLFTSNIALY
jgi:hypothetical protein